MHSKTIRCRGSVMAFTLSQQNIAAINLANKREKKSSKRKRNYYVNWMNVSFLRRDKKWNCKHGMSIKQYKLYSASSTSIIWQMWNFPLVKKHTYYTIYICTLYYVIVVVFKQANVTIIIIQQEWFKKNFLKKTTSKLLEKSL